MAAYLFINIVYNLKPLRLKRIPFLATFLTALALQLTVLMGFLLVKSIGEYPFNVKDSIFLIFIASLIMVIKDFKDIDGDMADEVKTLPIIFGKKIASLVVIVGLALFFAVILHYVPVDVFSLIWSLVFFMFSVGLILIVIKNKSFLNPQNLVLTIFLLLGIYFFGLLAHWFFIGYLVY